MQMCLGLEECNLSCCIWIPKKSVLHEQQRECNFCYAGRAFVMRNRHQEALKKYLMPWHASQTSWLMQNEHDKFQNLPDPDIFAAMHIATGFSQTLGFRFGEQNRGGGHAHHVEGLSVQG